MKSDGQILLDIDGQPYSETSQGGAYFYDGATTLDQAQHAHHLWRAMMAAYVAQPFDPQTYQTAKAKYESYERQLVGTAVNHEQRVVAMLLAQGEVEVPSVCMHCGKRAVLPVNDEADAAGLYQWMYQRQKVQIALPHWSREKREVLISGTHPQCWIEMFGTEEDA